MTIIDIRETEADVDTITFGSGAIKEGDDAAYGLEVGLDGDQFFYIEDSSDQMRINFDDVPNLILALKKAVTLWQQE